MLRSFLFSLFFFTGIFFISIIFLPALFMSQKVVIFGGKLMGLWCGFCLKFFLSVKILVKGSENIIQNKKFFIVSSHQSMFETFFLQTIFKSPVFILKKELLLIPIFGWYLKKIGSISITRNKTTKENLDFFSEISKIINKTNRPIIIFPQATRVLPTEKPSFKKGAGRVYEELKVFCQPIAINSGFVWPKNGKKISNRTITISILEEIKPGLGKKEFLETIENKIYSELETLN